MSGLFMPKELDERDLLEEKVEMNLEEEAPPVIKGDNVLAFATMNKVFIYEVETGRVEQIFTDPTTSHIQDICLSRGGLYHTAANNVVNTITAQTVAVRDGQVNALSSAYVWGDNSYLYDAGEYLTIYQTFSNKKISKHRHPVKSMCFKSGVLYSISNNQIYRNNPEPLGDRRLKPVLATELLKYILPIIRKPVKAGKEKIKRPIKSICLHQDRIHDAGDYVEVYETFSNKKLPFQFLPYMYTLCSHNRKLYGGGDTPCGIYDVNSGKKVLSTSEPVTAIESIPRKLVERYLR